MNVRQIVALTSLALAAGAVIAQDAAGATLTREEVRQSVQDARAAGRLAHSGSVAPEEEMRYAQAHPSTSTLTRSQQSTNVLQARAAGQLAHTGSVAPEEEMKYARAHPSSSTLTRPEVKAEVIEARANGTLIPAGQFGYSEFTRNAVARSTRSPDQTLAARSLK
jgi:Domain of unknown function (DUF4148)